MLAFLGYGSLFLNRPSRIFTYLNQAVFPVYIIHMPVQQLVAFVIFRWKLGAELTFVLHVLITLVVCGLFYEFVIRRIPRLYPVMGMKSVKKNSSQAGQPAKAGNWLKFGTALTLYVLSPLVFFVQMGFVLASTAAQFSLENTPAAVKSDSLWMAAKNNDVDALKEFIELDGASVDEPDSKLKLPALNWAALNGSYEAVAVLIEAGANVNVRNSDGSTPLSHAALMGHPDIVARLMDQSAKVNTVNSYQATPLDSTYADWKTVIGAAKFLGLAVKLDQWEKGRAKARQLLLDGGAKRKSELN